MANRATPPNEAAKEGSPTTATACLRVASREREGHLLLGSRCFPWQSSDVRASAAYLCRAGGSGERLEGCTSNVCSQEPSCDSGNCV
jgi:hypothetical protein